MHVQLNVSKIFNARATCGGLQCDPFRDSRMTEVSTIVKCISKSLGSREMLIITEPITKRVTNEV